MADPIVIQLTTRGVQEVVSSFRTVQQAIAALEKDMTSISLRGSRDRISASQKESVERAKSVTAHARNVERGYREEVRVVEKAEQEKQRAADRTAAYLQRVRNRSAEMAGASIMREADREIAERKRVAEASARFARSFAGDTMGNVAGAARGIVRTGAGFARSALNVGGGFGIADSVQRELKLTGIAGSIAASGQADPDGRRWKTRDILGAARGTARAYSMDVEETLGGIDAFKKITGNTGRGVALMPGLAKLALGTGASVKDLATNAANISMLNKGASNDEIMRLSMVQAKQGMTGAVEMSDFAKYGSRLTAAASLFGGDKGKNLGMMGAFAQLSKSEGGAASAAEATLAAQRFATDVQKHSKGLRAMGIETGDGHGGLRAADSIVKDMVTKTGGDVTRFSGMGLGERGVKVLTAMSKIYRDESGGTRQKGESDDAYQGRHKRGMAAVDRELGKFTEGLSNSDLDTSVKERLADADKQVEKAMNDLRDAVGTQLLPKFLDLIPVLRDLTPMFTDVLKSATELAGWFASNPFKGIGIAASAAVGKSIMDAAIGKGLEAAFSTALGQNLGKGGLVIGTATMAIAAGMITIDKIANDLDKARGDSLSKSTQAWGEAKHIERKAREGTATPEDLKRLGELRTEMGQQVQGETARQRDKSTLEKVFGGAIAQVVTGGEAGENSQKDRDTRLQQSKASLEELDKAIKAATLSLAALGKGADGASKVGTPASANSPTATLPLSARP